MSRKSEIIFTSIALLVLISIMCYFVFIKENKYTVTVNINYGVEENTKIEVIEGTSISTIEVPKREGYTFLYWTFEGKKLTPNSKIYKNMEIIAVWEKNK